MKRVCEPGLCELFGCEPRVFKKKIFELYAGGGVFCHFFKAIFTEKKYKRGGGQNFKIWPQFTKIVGGRGSK